MGCFLGIDAGTQSMKGVLIDPERNFCSDPVSVRFGEELPQYGSPEGFLVQEDPLVRHADPLMWLDALDLLLKKMHSSGLPMEDVEGISGSGQQHGTVYWNASCHEVLASLAPEKTLAEQIRPALSRRTSPIWMDGSTGKECAFLRERFGASLREITGSDSAERFSGPQIMKFAAKEKACYNNTCSISLVSSFLASVLAGKIMPVDYGDGAGMNLLDLRTLRWNEEIAEFTAPGLLKKLPACVPSRTVCGKLSPYFAKYGLRPGIPLNVWSGDNPNSLIGCGCGAHGSAIISLGTSDTFFSSIASLEDVQGRYGHIFGNPAGGFMTLVCFSNGSLVREAIREKFAMSREEFEAAAAEAEPGKITLLPYLFPESTPAVARPGIRCDRNLDSLTPPELIRGVLEAQFLTMKYHSGMRKKPRLIRLAGGGSASPLLRRLAADIFQTPVAVGGHGETAALGAAMRAAESCGNASFEVLAEKFCAPAETVRPDESTAEVYERALRNFAELIRRELP